MFGKEMNWTNWGQIRKWAKIKGFNNLVARMELNDKAWLSSGEVGRCQVEICDCLRLADNEEEAIEIAKDFDKAFASDFGLY